MKPIAYTLMLALLAISCKKQTCVTCSNVKVVNGAISDRRTECADTEREAMREALDKMPPDSTAVVQCRVD
jgi:hypothetical protein